MTPAQSDQFDDYGCACRCLIALANANGNPITKEQFLDRFINEPQFWFWKAQKQCGLTDTGLILDLIRALKLGTSFQVFFNKTEVRRRINERLTSGVILCTENREMEDGRVKNYFHCSLIGSKLESKGEFYMIPLDLDAKPQRGFAISDSKIDELAGYFLVIQPELEHS